MNQYHLPVLVGTAPRSMVQARLNHSTEQDVAAFDVLVVEDDRGIRGMIAEALSDEGYSVRTAVHGRDALTLLERAVPRLIIFDIMMPVMDGMALYGALQQDPRFRGVPVVVMSAAHNLQIFQGAAQVVAMLPKPFVLSTLLSIVETEIGTP